MRVFLNDRALFRISGLDSEVFLQSQLSNDISKIGANRIQLNAYCQHQGKIIALFWLMRSEESFLLSFPADLAEKMKSRLQMFILMSDVIIEDITNLNIQIGLINEYHPGAFSINENLSVLINPASESNKELMSSHDEWIKACIDCHIPEVFLISSE